MQPHPSDATQKFDQDWPTCFRDIQVCKCGRRRRRKTTDVPLVYYKLTLYGFGSGELKCWTMFYHTVMHPKDAEGMANSEYRPWPHCSIRPLGAVSCLIRVCTFCPDFSVWKLRITIIWATSWENLFMPYANNKGASAQSDQSLCCSLPRLYNTSACCSRNFKTLASLWSGAGWFESYLFETPKTGFLMTWLILKGQQLTNINLFHSFGHHHIRLGNCLGKWVQIVHYNPKTKQFRVKC